jgi:hypothetical protein
MNFIPLLAVFVPWARTPLSAFTAIYFACCVLSLEVQAITSLGTGTLRDLVPFNLAAAVGSAVWQWRHGAARWGWREVVPRVAPWPVVAGLAALVVTINILLPVEAADPYQLERIAQIERLGTLDYNPSADPKVNIAGAFYELVIADLKQIPVVGPLLVRMHGLLGLVLYLVTLAAVRTWFGLGDSAWTRSLLLVVPVVFHQFVLIKNDLFFAAPSLVVLAWLVSARDDVSWVELMWAGWLTGLVVGAKGVNYPLAIVLMFAVWVLQRRRIVSATALVTLGGLVGAVCSGLLLVAVLNLRVYGDVLASGPMSEMARWYDSPSHAAVGVVRFFMSLADMGQATTRIWPGRGGWGGTFGLPLIWAVVVLVYGYAAGARDAGRALLFAAAFFVLFALGFPDSDIAHRIVMGPGLLLLVVALQVASRYPVRWPRQAAIPVVLLSAAQIVRSAVLYSWRS